MQREGQEEFPHLGPFQPDILKFSASELLFLNEDCFFGKPCLTPWPAHTPVIVLPSSFLSDPDKWLRLPEPPFARLPNGGVPSSGLTGWSELCASYTPLCGSWWCGSRSDGVFLRLSHLLDPEPLEGWAPHRAGHRGGIKNCLPTEGPFR